MLIFLLHFVEKSSESGKVFAAVNDNDVALDSEEGDESRGEENSGEVEGNPEYFFIPSGNCHDTLFQNSSAFRKKILSVF
jgi:hypothetical protein